MSDLSTAYLRSALPFVLVALATALAVVALGLIGGA